MATNSSAARNIEFKRKIHFEANKHLDILTILQQMESNGFIDKIYDLINKIYDDEHAFTIKELRRIAKKAKSNNEVFDFMDHYSSNNAIFKKNLIAILEIFVDTVWNSKLETVYRECNKFEEDSEQMQSYSDKQKQSAQEEYEYSKNLSRSEVKTHHTQKSVPIYNYQSNLKNDLKQAGVSGNLSNKSRESSNQYFSNLNNYNLKNNEKTVHYEKFTSQNKEPKSTHAPTETSLNPTGYTSTKNQYQTSPIINVKLPYDQVKFNPRRSTELSKKSAKRKLR